MPRARRGYVLELDARVLAEGHRIHGEGAREFYGLQVATRLGLAKINVYRSLRRLTDLGLVDRSWEDHVKTRCRTRWQAGERSVAGGLRIRTALHLLRATHHSGRWHVAGPGATWRDDGQLCFAAWLTIWK